MLGLIKKNTVSSEIEPLRNKYDFKNPNNDVSSMKVNNNNYNEILNYLFTSLPNYQNSGSTAYKADLSNANELDKYFSYPHKSFCSIHIAGTNGKGSVSHMLASILKDAGCKTGLYTSPHLVDFRERIKINGEKISKSYVIDFINNNKKKFEEIKPSFFEMTVFMAFNYFKDMEVDIAIIETGLGGRLDTTNVIKPILSVITNIGIDHTNLLGKSISDIAKEKAGIIKSDVPVVIGKSEKETLEIFREYSIKKNSNLICSKREFNVVSESLDIERSIQKFKIYNSENLQIHENISLPLLGNCQSENLRTVLTSVKVLRSLGYNINNGNIFSGVINVKRNTGLWGRWEIIEKKPLVVADVGHNIDGIKDNMVNIGKLKPKQTHFILSFVKEKNIEEIAKILPDNALYYLTKSKNLRSEDPEKLKAIFESTGKKVLTFTDLSSAISSAKSSASSSDLVFIGGSTFIVGELLEN